MKLQRLKDEKGNQSQLMNSPVGTAFALGVSDLAVTDGRWNDSDMRSWEAGGNGAVMPFNWQV